MTRLKITKGRCRVEEWSLSVIAKVTKTEVSEGIAPCLLLCSDSGQTGTESVNDVDDCKATLSVD